MKKIILIVSLFFTINLSAGQYIGDVDVSTSGCVNYKWDTSIQPQANICYDINQVLFHSIRWEGVVYELGDWYSDNVKGSKSSTYYDIEGNAVYILVDVFGVPSNQPEVEYNYIPLTAVAYQHIVNNGIVNGTRFWFEYNGNVGSGNLKVRRYNSTVIDYADQIYIK